MRNPKSYSRQKGKRFCGTSYRLGQKLAGHGKVEVLNKLWELPAAGAVVFVSWPNFKGANGLPCRIWAVCEE